MSGREAVKNGEKVIKDKEESGKLGGIRELKQLRDTQTHTCIHNHTGAKLYGVKKNSCSLH